MGVLQQGRARCVAEVGVSGAGGGEVVGFAVAADHRAARSSSCRAHTVCQCELC